MKVTRQQLRRIIAEEILREWGSHGMPEIHFGWDDGGLEMIMYADGEDLLRFSNQKNVRDLISQLEELLAGPMRTSP